MYTILLIIQVELKNEVGRVQINTMKKGMVRPKRWRFSLLGRVKLDMCLFIFMFELWLMNSENFRIIYIFNSLIRANEKDEAFFIRRRELIYEDNRA